MRCAPARRLLTARRGGTLLPAASIALERHLAACPACAAEAAIEAALADHLAAGQGLPVPPIDVRARVLSEIAGLTAPEPLRPPLRPLAAGLLGAVLAGLAAWIAPGAVERALASGLVEQLDGGLKAAWPTLRALFGVAARTAAALSEALVSLVPAPPALLGAWALAFGALGHLAAATMFGACAWWIGRDLLRPAHRAVRGEDSR